MIGIDITQVSWEGIKKICQNYSKAISKEERTYQSFVSKSSTDGTLKIEITNLLVDFKKDVLDN